MSDRRRPMVGHELTCEEVAELAGLYVLGALETSEYEAITTHLGTCVEAHAEIREVGGVVPAFATLVEPIDAPADLKARVMAAVADTAQVPATAAQKLPGRYSTGGRIMPPRVSAPAGAAWHAPAMPWRVPAWASWGSALIAVLIVAVVGVWAVGVQSRVSTAEQRTAMLTEAIRSFSSPTSSIAILRENPAGASSGFAALAADGTAYLVMVNMAPAPADQTYQAWYIVGDQPTSAGLLTVDVDGLAMLVDPDALPGTQVVALTREPTGGSTQPTSDPFVTGTLQPQA